MASAIDASKPRDGVPASKSELRANLLAAKTEIEALQGDVAGMSRLTIVNHSTATVELSDADERRYLVLQPGVTTLSFPDDLSLGLILNGVNESGDVVQIATPEGGSTTFAGATLIPDDVPWSAVKTASSKVRIVVGG